jgi:hypothetical protein
LGSGINEGLFVRDAAGFRLDHQISLRQCAHDLIGPNGHRRLPAIKALTSLIKEWAASAERRITY